MELERSRIFSGRFLEWLRGKGRVLIMAHDNPDPDSLAAAMALKHLILVKTGIEATIGYGGIIGRGENRIMVEKLEIKAVHVDQLDFDQFQVICLVDSQPGTGNNSFPAERTVHLVIDHHPMRDASRDCQWVDVREEYGASATILFEYLVSQDVNFGTKLATILFYAIKSETQDLGREWSKADRQAYLQLIPLSNNRILFEITHPPVPREYFNAFSQAITDARVYEDLCVFNLYDIDNPDIVAELADFILRAEGVDTVFGMGRYGETVVLSMRTLSHDINAGRLIREAVGDLGTAGGHGMTAGGQIRPLVGPKAVLKELETTLRRRLQENLGRRPVRGRRLITG